MIYYGPCVPQCVIPSGPLFPAGEITRATLEFDGNTALHRRAGGQELRLIGYYYGGSGKVTWFQGSTQMYGGTVTTVTSGDPCSTRRHRALLTLSLPIASGPYVYFATNDVTPNPVRSNEVNVICK